MSAKDIASISSKCDDTSGSITNINHSKRGYLPLVTLWKNKTNTSNLTRETQKLDILLGIE